MIFYDSITMTLETLPEKVETHCKVKVLLEKRGTGKRKLPDLSQTI